MKLFAPGAPAWFLTAQRSIEGALTDPRVPECTQANLPSASANRGRQRFVTDLNAGVGMIAFSNGTNWVRLDTGATL